MIIKGPLPPLACATLSPTPRPRERPQRAGARGGPWPRQRRPSGVGQQAVGLPGGAVANAEEGGLRQTRNAEGACCKRDKRTRD